MQEQELGILVGKIHVVVDFLKTIFVVQHVMEKGGFLKKRLKMNAHNEEMASLEKDLKQISEDLRLANYKFREAHNLAQAVISGVKDSKERQRLNNRLTRIYNLKNI